MNDLISRQAAIDAVDGEVIVTGRANVEAVLGYINLAADRIKRLPSAQPELIRCKDCKYYEETDETIGTCLLTESGAHVKGYCSWAERKEE